MFPPDVLGELSERIPLLVIWEGVKEVEDILGYNFGFMNFNGVFLPVSLLAKASIAESNLTIASLIACKIRKAKINLDEVSRSRSRCGEGGIGTILLIQASDNRKDESFELAWLSVLLKEKLGDLLSFSQIETERGVKYLLVRLRFSERDSLEKRNILKATRRTKCLANKGGVSKKKKSHSV